MDYKEDNNKYAYASGCIETINEEHANPTNESSKSSSPPIEIAKRRSKIRG